MPHRSSFPFVLVLAILAFIIHGPRAHAQELSEWERVTALPGHSLADFWPGDSIMAVRTVRGQLLLSRDEGGTWEPKGFLVDQLHIGDGGSVVALTSDREILHSADNGRTFERVVEQLIPESGFVRLIGEGSDVYVVNYGDSTTRFFRSGDGGKSWGEIDSIDERMFRFSVGPDGSLYVLEQAQYRIMRYGAGDSAWSVATTAPDKLVQITFGRDDRLYAVSIRDSLYRSKSGSTTLAPFAPDFRFNAEITANSRGEVFIGGVPSNGTFSRFSSDGLVMQSIDAPLQSVSPRIMIGPHDDVWLLYPDYGAFRFDTSTSANTFLPVIFPGYADVQSFSLSPGGDWLLVANYRAYHSNDEGGSLVEIPLPKEVLTEWETIDYLDATTLVVYRSGAVDISVDTGASWKRSDLPLRRFHRIQNGTLFSLATLSPEKSTDKGKTWRRVAALRPVVFNIASRGPNMFAISQVAIQYSSDWGGTWDTTEHVGNPIYLNVNVITGTNRLIAGFGTIDTTDVGLPVYITLQAGDTGKILRQLPCNDLNTEYRFASGPDGRPHLAMACGLFRSDDEGVSWKKIADMPEGLQPTALLINESETFFLGTNEGLFKAQRISSVESEFTASAGGVVVRAIPNPVSGNARIEFVLPSPSHVRVNLFDPLGRRVARIAEGDFGAGEHAVRTDVLNDLPAGSYVLVIEAGDESVGQSVLVLPD